MTRGVSARQHVLLAVWRPSAGTLAVHDDEARHSTGLHDGYPIGFDHLGLATPDPLDVADALERDPSLMRYLLPPYTSVALAADRVRIQNDDLGFAKLYEAVSTTTRTWSNSPFIASLFTFARVERSEAAWGMYLAGDRFHGDTTPLKGVSLAPPRTVIEARNRPGAWTRRSGDFIGPIFGAEAPGSPRELVERLEEGLASVHRSITALGIQPIVVPLSGGRDSRVIAATALKHGRVDAFFTSVPPDLDVVIAEQLVQRLERPVPWTKRDKTDDARRRSEAVRDDRLSVDEAWNRLAEFEIWTDGDGDAAPYSRRAPSRTQEAVSLWGIGGEFARAFYYTTSDIARAADRTNAFWDGIARTPAFVDRSVARVYLRPRVQELQHRLADGGVHGLRQLDYFYVFERIRRLKGRLGGTAGVRPFFTLPYLQASLPMSPASRATTTYYRELVGSAFPA